MQRRVQQGKVAEVPRGFIQRSVRKTDTVDTLRQKSPGLAHWNKGSTTGHRNIGTGVGPTEDLALHGTPGRR
jgi:hypothetical protein